LHQQKPGVYILEPPSPLWCHLGDLHYVTNRGLNKSGGETYVTNRGLNKSGKCEGIKKDQRIIMYGPLAK
jgi:hypothetical protein